MSDRTVSDLDIDFDDLKPQSFDVWVSINRCADEYGLLRYFSVDVSYDPLTGENLDIGTVTGWVTWMAQSPDLEDAGDSLSQDAYHLAKVAQEIVDHDDLAVLESVLLVDRFTLLEQWRGHKLMGAIIENLVDLLSLYPPATLAVTQPEPLALDGSGPLEAGPERDAGMAKLRAACRKAGYKPWRDTAVWWRGFDVPEEPFF